MKLSVATLSYCYVLVMFLADFKTLPRILVKMFELFYHMRILFLIRINICMF